MSNDKSFLDRFVRRNKSKPATKPAIVYNPLTQGLLLQKKSPPAAKSNTARKPKRAVSAPPVYNALYRGLPKLENVVGKRPPPPVVLSPRAYIRKLTAPKADNVKVNPNASPSRRPQTQTNGDYNPFNDPENYPNARSLRAPKVSPSRRSKPTPQPQTNGDYNPFNDPENYPNARSLRAPKASPSRRSRTTPQPQTNGDYNPFNDPENYPNAKSLKAKGKTSSTKTLARNSASSLTTCKIQYDQCLVNAKNV
jgi:hypothetical protein